MDTKHYQLQLEKLKKGCLPKPDVEGLKGRKACGLHTGAFPY